MFEVRYPPRPLLLPLPLGTLAGGEGQWEKVGRVESMPATYKHAHIHTRAHAHTQHHRATRLTGQARARHTRSVSLLLGSLLTWSLSRPLATLRLPLPAPGPPRPPPQALGVFLLRQMEICNRPVLWIKGGNYGEGNYAIVLISARADITFKCKHRPI